METTENWKQALMVKRVGESLEAIAIRVYRVELLNVANAAAKLERNHIVWIRPEDLTALAEQCGMTLKEAA